LESTQPKLKLNGSGFETTGLSLESSGFEIVIDLCEDRIEGGGTHNLRSTSPSSRQERLAIGPKFFADLLELGKRLRERKRVPSRDQSGSAFEEGRTDLIVVLGLVEHACRAFLEQRSRNGLGDFPAAALDHVQVQMLDSLVKKQPHELPFQVSTQAHIVERVQGAGENFDRRWHEHSLGPPLVWYGTPGFDPRFFELVNCLERGAEISQDLTKAGPGVRGAIQTAKLPKGIVKSILA